MYQAKDVAKLSGVSIRTLHYYDQIGILRPEKKQNGYRLYTEEDLNTLQQILFYRYLEFPLKDIRNLMKSENRRQRLEDQLSMLREKERNLKTLIDTIEKTIQTEIGEKRMSVEEKFKGFLYEEGKAYRQEAVEKYGQEVIESSEQKLKGKEQYFLDEMNKVFFAFADHLKDGIPAEDPSSQAIAERLHKLINDYSFNCSAEVFGFIGKGYVSDQRFTDNIDKFAKGTAQYASDAIAVYVKQQTGK